MNDAMLDLETLGTGNDAAIVSIGACLVDLHGDGVPIGISHRFYARVHLGSSIEVGLKIDPSTVLWWLQQSDVARKSTFEGVSLTLPVALRDFNAFLIAGGITSVWGNASTFDNVIIRSAYRACGIVPAWGFRGDKCYRTVLNLLPKERQPAWDHGGVQHNALDDAVNQALRLQKAWKILALP